MSVTSRKSAARPKPVLEQTGREVLAQTEEPSHCERLGAAKTGYQVLLRTPAAKQKSMSLQDNQNIHQSISCKLEFGWGGGGVGGG